MLQKLVKFQGVSLSMTQDGTRSFVYKEHCITEVASINSTNDKNVTFQERHETLWFKDYYDWGSTM